MNQGLQMQQGLGNGGQKTYAGVVARGSARVRAQVHSTYRLGRNNYKGGEGNGVIQLKNGGEVSLWSKRGKHIPVRVSEEVPSCLLPNPSCSRSMQYEQLHSNAKRGADQMSDNGGNCKIAEQASSDKEEEGVDGCDDVSRVLETVRARSDEQALSALRFWGARGRELMGSSRIVWSITAMLQPRKMLQTDKESLPDDESYDLVIGMLLLTDQIDAALKYIDLTLKSGYILSVNVFSECVRNCVNKGRLDTLVSIIERCKKMDQNKALCPPRNLCNYIANVAMEEDSSELAYYALEFLAKWIA
ncbi:hypothetical protein ACSBR2_043047 [Camellia fascicularis]